jgi:tRNA-2-methylthio-N6-dimethylallyladenosine synthase
MVEGHNHTRNQVIGRSSQNKTVNFVTTQPIMPAMGNYLPVRITQTFPNSLVGEAVSG